MAPTGIAVGGRATKSATPSDCGVAHRRRAGGKNNPLSGCCAADVIDIVGDSDGGDIRPSPVGIQSCVFDELLLGIGGDHDDLALEVGAPEPFHGADGVTDRDADAREYGIGTTPAETDQVDPDAMVMAAVTNHQWCRCRHRRRQGRR